ncbi:S-layer homology domain-containing protein, partial [Paenibacillus periandrae]|uniref:S-layer homology domain-containing protein n=1 Tax=Paenibacillus periandrae TaxID=1761741 RepID=UPI001F094FBE
TLTSTIGTVSTGGTANETITNIPNGTTLAALKAAITPSANATFQVYDADGTTVAATLVTGKKVIVIAQDGTTKVTYTVTVNAPPSTNALLSSLTVNQGTITFSPSQLNYLVNVSNPVTSLNFNVTKAEANQALTVTGAVYTTVTGNVYSYLTSSLIVGANPIQIVVTAQGGQNSTYNLTVNRAATTSSNSSGGGSSTSTNNTASTDGKLTLPAGSTGEVSLQQEVTVSIPADATKQELKLTIEKLLDIQNLVTDTSVLASPVFEILKNFSDNFSKPITLTFAFDKAKLSGNQTVAVFYFDEAKKVWVEVPGGKINENHITVDVNHLTKYAVFAIGEGAAMPTPDTKPTINFNDISGHWAETSIKQAVSSGIVSGYSDGTFMPEKSVTRAEFAVMLMNALKPQGEGAALMFTDKTKIGEWAQKAVAQAVQAGIITGYEDNTFRQDAQITRAEMAVMIASALGQSKVAAVETSFSDNKAIPDWAKGAVDAMKKLGIIEGKGANEFAPVGKTTRAEAVTVLLKMLAFKGK